MKKFRNIVCNIILFIVILNVGIVCFYQKNDVADVSASPIYSGNSQNNNVSIMINVYWGTEYIDSILDVFDEYNVRTTFFVGGMWASKYPEMLEKIYGRGHEIANHGYHHKDHKCLTEKMNYDEIISTHRIVKALTGYEMTLFAPPSGSFSDITLQVADSMNYKTIMWTKDTIDWRDSDSNLIYSRAVRNCKNGDLILMHPTECSLIALPKIIEYYQSNNFNVTTVSQTLKSD